MWFAFRYEWMLASIHNWHIGELTLARSRLFSQGISMSGHSYAFRKFLAITRFVNAIALLSLALFNLRRWTAGGVVRGQF